MLDPHPPLASFPFALLTLVLIFELLSLRFKTEELRRASGFILLALIIIAPMTFFSGYFAADDASKSFQIPLEAIEEHRSFGKLFLLSLFPVALGKLTAELRHDKKAFRLGYLICLVVSLVLAASASYHGGKLVFIYGAAVNLKE